MQTKARFAFRIDAGGRLRGGGSDLPGGRCALADGADHAAAGYSGGARHPGMVLPRVLKPGLGVPVPEFTTSEVIAGRPSRSQYRITGPRNCPRTPEAWHFVSPTLLA